MFLMPQGRTSLCIRSVRCPEVDRAVGQTEVQILPLELLLWPLVSDCRCVLAFPIHQMEEGGSSSLEISLSGACLCPGGWSYLTL